ncbi:Ferrous iron transport protein B [Sedimentisphaera cyanobacteriorum]|uniref:Ferrous iron transport protein B n=1 Tax=Sedimentisphaera cyanobacteriorum TaxID=1940790 RepID=A0A1Q2HQT5_9BACT|nr:ferrous iron transport protein B [Sedimentisphaera cyanobacteriorum]AQQ09626.1 Ferrous iron transport protein B [Sedimentisphaera cyanobacteriorum]
MEQITVGLTGNPNCGKSCVFNSLTGAKQHVGNYPGVTVEKVEGWCEHKGFKIRIVDLPGTYSISAHSMDEKVARDFVLSEECDVIVNVIDSNNFERNLFLTTQLFELNKPLVAALNMYDVATKNGLEYDKEKIGTFLNGTAVSTVGNKGEGIKELLDAVVYEYNCQREFDNRINYGSDIEERLERLTCLISKEITGGDEKKARYHALQLLQMDCDINEFGKDAAEVAQEAISELNRMYGDNPHILMAEKRYGFISGLFEQTVRKTVEIRHDASDAIDKILLNRVLGLPIFFGMMYLVFKLTFWLGDPVMTVIEHGFDILKGFVLSSWPAGGEGPLQSLIVDGIIGGVGGVVVFLPNIIFLFLAIAVLEDSGYMARAAFLMDRIMKKIGLHGQSFIPMLIGFGCTVPAIMGTRILNERKSRLTTIMILPLISCGARLPIYALIIPAFFPKHLHGFMMWSMYVIGILIAIILAKVLRKTLFKGRNTVMLMELPPYRVPTLRSVFTHMWQKSWLYLKKAGTLILAISIILWAMTSYPKLPEEQTAGMEPKQAQAAELKHTAAGRIATTIEPATELMGFDYKIGTALIGAFAAKEVFVAQMGIVNSLGEAGAESKPLREKLKDQYTPLQGFCVMLFCLISTPCIATVAICRKETQSWAFAMGQFMGLTVLAFVITAAVYQIGMLLT